MSNPAVKLGLRPRPFAFTEQGVAMLSSVLDSDRAVDVNIEIMRAFVRLREMLASHADLARRLDELERKYDQQFAVVFQAIRESMKAHAVALAMLDIREAAGGVSRMSPEQRAAEAVYLFAVLRRLDEFVLREDDITDTLKEWWPIV